MEHFKYQLLKSGVVNIFFSFGFFQTCVMVGGIFTLRKVAETICINREIMHY